jgi:cytochrome bd-type quinol oxidase subunit 2
MKRDRGQLAMGLILILVGAWFVAVNQVPGLQDWANQYLQWPLNIVAIGAALLVVGLLVGAPGMAVPAAIVAGVGGILYYQNTSGNWSSWSYLWTLIFGFVGVGTLLHALFTWNGRRAREGMNAIAVSAVLFLIFATIFGGLEILGGSYGVAALLVVIGLWLVVNGLFRRGGQS